MKLPFLAGALALLSACAPLTPPPHGEHIVANIPYKQASGRTLHLDLYQPAGPGPHPLVYWMHGGGWKYGDKGWMLYVRSLTRSGFAVASVEYRLSGRAQYPAQYEDCRDGFALLQQRADTYHLDCRNFYVAGASAGAHLAALLAEEKTSREVRAAVLLYPPTDLLGFENQGATRGYLPELLGGPVNTHRALAAAASPVRHVTAETPSMLFFHGDRDTLVPLAQSRKLQGLLQARGIEAKLVVMHGYAHTFALPAEQFPTVVRFLRSHAR